MLFLTVTVPSGQICMLLGFASLCFATWFVVQGLFLLCPFAFIKICSRRAVNNIDSMHTNNVSQMLPPLSWCRILSEDKAMVEQLRPDLLLREISVKADLPQMAFRQARMHHPPGLKCNSPPHPRPCTAVPSAVKKPWLPCWDVSMKMDG